MSRHYRRRKLTLFIILVPIAWGCFTALSARMKGKRYVNGINHAQAALVGSRDRRQGLDFLENRIKLWGRLEDTAFDAQISYEREIDRLELEELDLADQSRKDRIDFEHEVNENLERIAVAKRSDIRDQLIRKVRDGKSYSDKITVICLELIDLRRKVDQKKAEVEAARRERKVWVLKAGGKAMRPSE